MRKLTKLQFLTYPEPRLPNPDSRIGIQERCQPQAKAQANRYRIRDSGYRNGLGEQVKVFYTFLYL